MNCINAVQLQIGDTGFDADSTEEMVGRIWQLFNNSLNPVPGPFSSTPENARENLENVLKDWLT